MTGLRQFRKTTLTQVVFFNKSYVSLEALDIRDFATSDPRGFFKPTSRWGQCLMKFSAGLVSGILQSLADQLMTYSARGQLSETWVVSDFFDSLKKFQKLAGGSVGQVALIYGGAQAQHREAAKVIPYLGKNSRFVF